MQMKIFIWANLISQSRRPAFASGILRFEKCALLILTHIKSTSIKNKTSVKKTKFEFVISLRFLEMRFFIIIFIYIYGQTDSI